MQKGNRSTAQILAGYFQRFPNFNAQYRIAENPSPDLQMVVILPAFAENVEPVLQSLGNCALVRSSRVELILVINQPANVEQYRKVHRLQARQWNGKTLQNGLKVFAILADDLPPDQAGVGLARKIGMDCALERFQNIDHDGFLVCLDADCQVSDNYLNVLLQQQARPQINGLSLRYRHLYEPLPHPQRQLIVNYEIWLRYYHLALRWSGYPHYFQTVGSSMVCRASAYARAGGMNRRKAGEDFYFLHKIMPRGGFEYCGELTVFPSARVSERVPFGTGRAMLEQGRGQKDFDRLYHPQIFRELKLLHSNLPALFETGRAPQPWDDFLYQNPKLARGFKNLRKRSNNAEMFANNFWHWWDGFNVLRYVHHRQQFLPKLHSAAAVKELWGLDLSGENLLEKMRQLENVQNWP